MATYSQFQLDANRHTGQTTQNVLRNVVIWAEAGLKFTFSFISDMIRMVMGK